MSSIYGNDIFALNEDILTVSFLHCCRDIKKNS